MNGYYNFSDYVGEKVYNSENKVIKAVKEYTLAFSKSINEGEQETRTSNELV